MSNFLVEAMSILGIWYTPSRILALGYGDGKTQGAIAGNPPFGATAREIEGRMIKVKSEVRIYEEKGRQIPGPQSKWLFVQSHWNCDDRVALVFQDPQQDGLVIDIVVIASDLIAAIRNATNTGYR